MPKGNEENNTGPEKTDPQAMFQLMLSCALFRNVDVACLEKLTIARNKLLHSSDNVVGDNEMKTYFKHMKVILREATKDDDVDQIIRDRIAEDVKRIKKLKHAEMTMALFDDALKVKRKRIFDEFERSLTDNNPDVLKELLELATNTVEEIQQLKTHAEYKAVVVYCKMENKNLSNDLAKLKVAVRQRSFSSTEINRLRIAFNELQRSFYAEEFVIVVVLTICMTCLLRLCLYVS